MNQQPVPIGDPEDGRNLASIVIERLRLDIVRCVFKPGEKLRIQSLCERYGINASAIREALSRLVTEELVEAVDHRGYRASSVSRDDLIDLTRTRISIECLAMSQSIQVGDAEWESQVLAAYHRLSKCAPPPVDRSPGSPQAPWELLHRQFHESLLAGCGSRWLLSICRALFEKSERYRHIADGYTTPLQRDALGEHQQLMEAVLGRNAAAACSMLESHFTETMQIILEQQKNAAQSAEDVVQLRSWLP
jgi:GntR family carbon starvation induced transcriptional regulator